MHGTSQTLAGPLDPTWFQSTAEAFSARPSASGRHRQALIAAADILVDDDHDLIQKAVGGWIRGAGKQDPQRLQAFLDDHAAMMSRRRCVTPSSISTSSGEHYMGLKQAR